MRTPLPSSCGIVGKTQVVFWDFSGDSTRSLEWGYQFFRCILVFGRCLFWNLLDVFKYNINPRRVALKISTNQPNEVGHLMQSCPRRWHCGSGASRKLSFLGVIFFEVSKTERDFTRRDFCFFVLQKMVFSISDWKDSSQIFWRHFTVTGRDQSPRGRPALSIDRSSTGGRTVKFPLDFGGYFCVLEETGRNQESKRGHAGIDMPWYAWWWKQTIAVVILLLCVVWQRTV